MFFLVHKALRLSIYNFVFFCVFFALLLLCRSKDTRAYEIRDKWYGSLNAGVGYMYKYYANAGRKVNEEIFFNGGGNVDIFSAIDAFNEFEYNGVLKKQRVHHYFFLQVWNNFYYKLTNRIHPFVGLQANVSLPFTDVKFIENNLTCSLGQIFVKDVFAMSVLLGTKFLLGKAEKNISISPYGLIGVGVVNVKQIKDRLYSHFALEGYNMGYLANTDLGYNRYNYISFNTGAGVDIQIDKVIFGAEYRYTTYKSGVGDLYDDTGFNVVNHNFLVKVGYQFL